MYQYMELYDCKLLVQICSSDIAVSTQIVRLASALSGLLMSLCIYLSADMSCLVYNQQAACTLEILDQYSDVITICVHACACQILEAAPTLEAKSAQLQHTTQHLSLKILRQESSRC